MIRVRYFAALRDRLGIDEEEIPPLSEISDVADLRRHLQNRGGVWAEALGDAEQVLAAVNQEMARPDTPVGDGDEVGFFPPVTGG